MKKVLFLTNSVNLANSSDGLAKKIHAQVRAFDKLGYDVHLAGINEDKYLINNQEFTIEGDGVFAKNRGILENVASYIKESSNFDILYIRKFYFTYDVLTFLRSVRNKFKFIILEIPTYPYYGELNTLRAKLGYWVEALTVTHRLNKYVDRIVTFSDDDKIFNIDTIKISNGIDSNEMELFSDLPRNTTINFISVSSVAYWHGIDRLINSINETANIHFNIVGPNNNELKELKKNVLDKGLKNKVTFCGYKNKDELSELYKISHIGIGSLGRHRSGIVALNSLKNREYLAKGLPVVYSEIDSDLDDLEFVYKASPDETLMNINHILDWYSTCNISRFEIMKFSNKFLWETQIQFIIDEIEL